MQITLDEAKKVLDVYKESPTAIRDTFYRNFIPQNAIDYLNSNTEKDLLVFSDYMKQIESFDTETIFVFASLLGVASQRMLTERETKAVLSLARAMHSGQLRVSEKVLEGITF